MGRDVYFYLHAKDTAFPLVYRVRNKDGVSHCTYLYNVWNELESLDHLQHIVLDHAYVEFKNALKEENE